MGFGYSLVLNKLNLFKNFTFLLFYFLIYQYINFFKPFQNIGIWLSS